MGIGMIFEIVSIRFLQLKTITVNMQLKRFLQKELVYPWAFANSIKSAICPLGCLLAFDGYYSVFILSQEHPFFNPFFFSSSLSC
jgi:hypothetical protein